MTLQILLHLSGKRLTFIFSEADTWFFFGHAPERDQVTTPDVEQRKIQPSSDSESHFTLAFSTFIRVSPIAIELHVSNTSA